MPGELFNLDEDISERDNLYGERAEMVGKLADVLARVKSPDTKDAATSGSERDTE